MIAALKRFFRELRKPSPASPQVLARTHDLLARESLTLGNAARDSMDWGAAADHYVAYLRLKPGSVPIQVQLGNMLRQAGAFDQSEAAYRAAIRQAPSADAWLQLALLFREQSRRGDAIDALVEAGRLDPGLGIVHDELIALGAHDLIPGGGGTVSARGLQRVGAGLAETLDRLQTWIATSTFPLEAYDSFRRTYQIGPPPGRAEVRVTVVIDADLASPARVRSTLMSLLDQRHEDWSALVFTNPDTLQHPVAAMALSEPRIRFELFDMAATVIPTVVDPILSVTAGTILDPEALGWMVLAQSRVSAPGIYCDHDHVFQHWRNGLSHFEPCLQPMPDPHDLRSTAHPPAAVLVASDALKGALAQAFASGDREAIDAVRGDEARRSVLLAAMASGRVGHLPRILASVTHVSETASHGTRDALEQAPGVLGPTRAQPANQAFAATAETIVAIIPTRDEPEVLEACVASLIARCRQPDRLRIVVADNRSEQPQTAQLLGRLRDTGVEILAVDEPFNWSRINNHVATERTEDILLFANNDTEMLSDGWDDSLRQALAQDGVGVVGARLLYPDRAVQHAGMIFGINAGAPMHEGVGAAEDDAGPGGRWKRNRSATAVTGAFMATTRQLFTDVGGFDGLNLAVGYNDVDFCLRVRALGLTVLYVADIELIHHESRSRGFNDTQGRIAWDQGELTSLNRRWGEALSSDPGYNPHWDGASGRPFERFRDPSLRQVLAHLDLSAVPHPWRPTQPAFSAEVARSAVEWNEPTP